MRVATIVFLLTASMAAFADEPIGRVDYASKTVVNVTPVKTTVFVEPNDIVRQGKVEWLNSHNFIAFSYSKRGDQVDFVRRGNFHREVEIRGNRMHIRRCGNPVNMLEVEVEQHIYQKESRYLERVSPAPLPPAPAAPNVIVNNYNYTFGAIPSYQLGGVQSPVVVSTQLGSIGFIPVSRVNVSVSAVANAPTSISVHQSQQQQQQQQQSVAVDP